MKGFLDQASMTESSSSYGGGEFRVNTFTTGDQTDSSVAMNRLTGDYVITWTSAGQDGSGAGIYAQRYSGSTGAADGTEFKVNTTTAGDQTDASVAVDRFNSNFVVTWTSASDGSGKGIYAQRYNSSGVAQGAQFLVNTSTAGDQSDSTVAIDGAGEIFAMWTNAGVTANGLQVYGQQFDKNGIKKEAEFVVNTTTTGDQGNASVSIDVYGRVTVAWSGNGIGDANGVSVQLFRTDLHPFSADEHDHDGHDDASHEVPVSVAVGAQYSSNKGHVHDLNVGSGTGAADRFERLVSRLRGHKSEPQSELSNSVGHGRREADLAKLSLAIDSLFGSEAWLSGRHYRSANTGA